MVVIKENETQRGDQDCSSSLLKWKQYLTTEIYEFLLPTLRC